jgi:hypothetical protein
MKILKAIKFLLWGCRGKDHFKKHLIDLKKTIGLGICNPVCKSTCAKNN